MYLAIRSDKPEAEIYLLSADGAIQAQHCWSAGRTLARDLPGAIDELVGGDYGRLWGVIAFQGSGSFTGLRIGITVANAIAYGRTLPIVGTAGDSWLAKGAQSLAAGHSDRIVLPVYGAPPHITPAQK